MIADGTLMLLTRDIIAPNDTALLRSGKTLYISNSDVAQASWLAFGHSDDGALTTRGVFAAACVGVRNGSDSEARSESDFFASQNLWR